MFLENFRGLLGSKAVDDQIRLCSASILGQCLHYHFARPVIERLYPAQRFGPDDVDRIAAHITQFSLAALRAVATEEMEERLP